MSAQHSEQLVSTRAAGFGTGVSGGFASAASAGTSAQHSEQLVLARAGVAAPTKRRAPPSSAQAKSSFGKSKHHFLQK
jgi:hypothetical protein